MNRFAKLLAGLCVLAAAAGPAAAQNEIPVTYQGRLVDNGAAQSGFFDFQFTVFDAATGGTKIVGEQIIGGVRVTDGLFTLELQLPRDGTADEERWLEIRVRPAGGGSFTLLTDRQRITPAPEAGNTAAARLQPDDSVQIGFGGPLGVRTAYDQFDAVAFGTVIGATQKQTFIAETTGTVTDFVARYNEAFTGAVDVYVELEQMDTNVIVASGVILNQTAPFTSIPADTINGLVLCGAPYELRIFYTDATTGVPETKARTGALPDPYPDGEVVNNPAADLNARIDVDRGASQVTVFDNGLALLNGGMVVGPDDSGDTGVVLPKSSVNPGEMLGEPGLIEGETPLAADPSDAVRTARVLAPVDGYVLAIGTGGVSLGNSSVRTVGLSSSLVGGPVFQQSANSNVDEFTPFSVTVPIMVQGVFPIEAGQQIDIYLTVPSGGLSDARLNAMFFPTSYQAANPVGP